MRWLLLLLTPLTALAAPTTRGAVRSALDGSATMTAEGWRWLGDDVDLKLVETAKDARVPLTTRVRAVWALSTLGTEPARGYLSHVTATEDVETPLLAAAVEAFASAFRAEGTRAAIEHLGHREASVRLASARALGRVGTDAARKALSERRAFEGDDTVLAEIAFALKSAVAVR